MSGDKPEQIPSGWSAVDTVSASHTEQEIRLTIALKQSNLEQLEETVLHVSNPRDPAYGKYLSKEELDTLTRPSAEATVTVTDWLTSHGVMDRCAPNGAGDLLQCTLPVTTVETMLEAKYSAFKHSSGLEVLRAAGGYSVPTAVAPFLDFIQPTTKFPVLRTAKPVTDPESAKASLLGANTPSSLRTLYSVGDTKGNSSSNSLACTAFLGQVREGRPDPPTHSTHSLTSASRLPPPPAALPPPAHPTPPST